MRLMYGLEYSTWKFIWDLVLIVSRPPKDSRLVPFVQTLWTCETENSYGLEQILPNGRAQLLINLQDNALHNYHPSGLLRQRASGMAVQGPLSSPLVIDMAEQAKLCGVSFSPGGAFAFFGGAFSENGFGLVDLVDLSWPEPWALHEQLSRANHADERLDLLEAAFLDLAPISQSWDKIVRQASVLLARGVNVRDVARQCNTSQQTLITRFRERTGLTPKTFSRIERFQRLLRNYGNKKTWAEAALDAGFSDQSHMVRDFKCLAGVSPTTYEPSGSDQHNHIVLPT